MDREDTVNFISILGRLWYVSKDEKTRENLHYLQQYYLNELVNYEMDLVKLREDQNV